jgi:hypothetical protein
VGWVGSSGIAVVIYAHGPSGGFGWATWTASNGWTLQTPSWTHATLEADFAMARIAPASSLSSGGDLMLVIEDPSGSLWATSYDGVGWTDQSPTGPLATSVDVSQGCALGVVSR